MASVQPEHLLSVRGLVKDFGYRRIRRGGSDNHLRAVDEVSLTVSPGEAVGIVGESGSGKTTVARCLLRLIRPTAGEVVFDGTQVLELSRSGLRLFRRQAQIVFQDPYASLDPRFTVLRALAEPLRVHGMRARSEIPARAAELLQMVGLNDDFLPRYQHELSGGEAQRVAIARALATEPRFLVLDEPTSALDASARLKVITLLGELRRDLGLSYLVISHDLSIIRHLCDRVLVMYLGRVVEEATGGELFSNPEHPYTRALLSATPALGRHGRSLRIRLREAGDEPPPRGGCVLAPRCPHAVAECAGRPQQLEEVGTAHVVACHRVTEGQLVLPPPIDESTVAAETGGDS